MFPGFHYPFIHVQYDPQGPITPFPVSSMSPGFHHPFTRVQYDPQGPTTPFPISNMTHRAPSPLYPCPI